jgi:hypothetical protein
LTTYFLILAALLGLGIIGYALMNRWRLLGQILMSVGCVGGFSFLAWQLYRDVFASAPKAPDRYDAVVAYMMGEQVAGEFGDKRGQILVILPPEAAAGPKVLDALFDSFARVLVPFSNLELKEATLARSNDSTKNSPVTLEAFEQAMAAAPNALACVSFAGVPSDLGKLSLFKEKNVPALFVYDPLAGKNWAEPLKKRLIHRVIVPRPHFALPKGKPIAGPPEEIFQRYFLWATPETADEIVEQLLNK